jgi:TATA-box binding protein (TBP) (component of TFIID and TFIIIB)
MTDFKESLSKSAVLAPFFAAEQHFNPLLEERNISVSTMIATAQFNDSFDRPLLAHYLSATKVREIPTPPKLVTVIYDPDDWDAIVIRFYATRGVVQLMAESTAIITGMCMIAGFVRSISMMKKIVCASHDEMHNRYSTLDVTQFALRTFVANKRFWHTINIDWLVTEHPSWFVRSREGKHKIAVFRARDGKQTAMIFATGCAVYIADSYEQLLELDTFIADFDGMFFEELSYRPGEAVDHILNAPPEKSEVRENAISDIERVVASLAELEIRDDNDPAPMFQDSDN